MCHSSFYFISSFILLKFKYVHTLLFITFCCEVGCDWFIISFLYSVCSNQIYIFVNMSITHLSFPSRSNWLKPCCGRRVALWQVCLLSAGFNCVLVACVIVVVLFLSLELLIDTKLLQCKQSISPICIYNFLSLYGKIFYFNYVLYVTMDKNNCQ